MSENTDSKSLNESYIFTFGSKGVGKSTLLASICYNLKGTDEFLIRYNSRNKEGMHLLSEWMYLLSNGLFPNTTDPRKPFEVEIGIESLEKKFAHEFHFLDIAGENLINTTPSLKYNDIIESYIKKADLFLIVTDPDRAASDDIHISVFLQRLSTSIEKDVPIVLVVTKWDLIGRGQSSEDFVKAKMPSTYKWLKHGNFPKSKILDFKIGQVSLDDEYGYTFKLDTIDSQTVSSSILDYLVKPQINVNKENVLRKKLRKALAAIDKVPNSIQIHRRIKDIYEQLGEVEKAKEVEETITRLVEKQEFRMNMGKQISLQRAELHHLDFFGDLKWDFQPQVNVLLGRNGYGKSHLLRLLTALLQKDDDKISSFFQDSKGSPSTRLTVKKENEPLMIARNKLVFEESIGKVPLLAIPDLRTVDKSRTTVAIAGDENDDLAQYGAYHFLYQKPYDGLIQNFLYQLCITYLDKGKTFDLPIFRLIQNVVGKLSDHRFKFHKIDPTGHARFKIDVITEGNKTPMPLQKASQGTLSILSILGLVFQYLNASFPEVPEEKLLEQPAIVFIDELDAHLHPGWQQKIIGILRENFPNVQFVVTAHSPLVVAGCKEGEVAVLRKADCGFVVKQFQQDFVGYRAAELYQKVFEIEEKDDAYLYYTALFPFRGNIRDNIEALEKKRKSNSLSNTEEKELEKLYDDLYYSERANEMFEKRLEYSRILRENKKLKTLVKKFQKMEEKKDKPEHEAK